MQESLTDILRKNQASFGPVVPFNPATDRITTLDLTAANTTLTDEILNSTPAFSAWVNTQCSQAGARYAAGGYAEHRTVYKVSRVFDGQAGAAPRRLHLGLDIWGRYGTAVMAPLPGIVHSFAFNNNPGDYGATILLSHQLNGITFYTLYGHLSLSSLQNLQEGQRIEKGQIFAAFGIPAENGQWPPHLHMQIIEDIGTWKGDYPGVCAWEEREKWLANSPDPELILQLNQYLLR